MDDIQFTIIDHMLKQLASSHELVHSNGAQVFIVNKYTYMVSVINLQNNSRKELDSISSATYLEWANDSRQDKYNYINRMEEYIMQSASFTKGRQYDLTNHDCENSFRAALDGLVYHWNGGQLVVENGRRVVTYDFTTATVYHWTLAASWRYRKTNALRSVDVDSVMLAASGAMDLRYQRSQASRGW